MFQSLWVCIDHFWHWLVYLPPKLEVFEFALFLEECCNTLYKISWVEKLWVKDKALTIIKLGKVLYILNHRKDELNTEFEILHVLHQAWLILLHKVLQKPDGAFDAIQRCFEIMNNWSKLKQVLLFSQLKLVQHPLLSDVFKEKHKDGLATYVRALYFYFDEYSLIDEFITNVWIVVIHISWVFSLLKGLKIFYSQLIEYGMKSVNGLLFELLSLVFITQSSLFHIIICVSNRISKSHCLMEWVLAMVAPVFYICLRFVLVRIGSPWFVDLSFFNSDRRDIPLLGYTSF